jgi:hypothetical protein
MNDQVERVAKTLPLALAGLYVVGFLIVALHLAGYGASSLDLIKIQYLAAGFWFGCVFVFFFGMTAPVRSLVSEFIHHRAQGAFWRNSGLRGLAGAMVADPVMVMTGVLVFRFNQRFGPTFGSQEFTERSQQLTELGHSLRFLVLSLIGFDITLRIWFCLKERARDSSIREYRTRYYWRASALFVVLGLLFCTTFFARDVYPTIPFSFGGGQPRQVVFWLGSGTTTDSFLEREGTTPYTVPYQLLLENENSLVVVSPKDGQRAIEFDRKAVGAVVVLGKRPKSAPAHFLRQLKEP